ncbi:hypothetical protein D1159_12595 [Pseudoflavonifractor sp. 524-17]|uniref:hypothetical protein n=1 Tax=Pseudoflavonifractor sp. 524-17 TaxID=2304577 RepID=UPI0013799776|nr:hypothetical protein [Pseudoflavonifractor sp. 524-17]NCE65392.1 hypothetical protein [Pseudoflavonifractor sp. 524-17]
MSGQRVLEIKERLQATTPGAWKVWQANDEYFGDDSPVVVTENGQYIAQTSYDNLSHTVRETMAADARFIAYAKEDISYLLERLEIFLRE